MTKRFNLVIVCVVLLTLVLSGCQLPASQAPETEASQAMTTPISLQTDSPESMTQTSVAKLPATSTLISPSATATSTPEPTSNIVIPTVTRPATYVLQEGEFPYCIARRFNLDPADLISLNGLTADELVSPGTTLQIPQSAPGPVKAAFAIPIRTPIPSAPAKRSIQSPATTVTSHRKRSLPPTNLRRPTPSMPVRCWISPKLRAT